MQTQTYKHPSSLPPHCSADTNTQTSLLSPTPLQCRHKHINILPLSHPIAMQKQTYKHPSSLPPHCLKCIHFWTLSMCSLFGSWYYQLQQQLREKLHVFPHVFKFSGFCKYDPVCILLFCTTCSQNCVGQNCNGKNRVGCNITIVSVLGRLMPCQRLNLHPNSSTKCQRMYSFRTDSEAEVATVDVPIYNPHYILETNVVICGAGFFASIPDCRSCNSPRTVHPECMPIPVPPGDHHYPQVNHTTGEPLCFSFMRSLPGQQHLGKWGDRFQFAQHSLVQQSLFTYFAVHYFINNFIGVLTLQCR